MATEVTDIGNIRFGLFEFNRRSLELRRNGVRVKLQDQPGQILSALLEVPGDLVTREELRKRLWAADTFVDFDHSLNTAIKRLRDALGDTADNPIFIETLSRRGYRFMAPLAVSTNGNSNERVVAGKNGHHGSSVSPVAAATGRWSARFAWWGVAGLVVTAGAVSAGWHAGHRTIRPLQPREIRLTANSADAPVEGGTISPDARMLLYSDKVGLHVKDTTSGEIHHVALPEDFKVTWGSWFPDQSHVLISAAASAKERTSLWRLSLFGGAPQKLMEDGEMGRVSPDGKKVAFLRGEYPRREIWTMNVDGGEARKEVDSSGSVYGMPVWSPDSRVLAFVCVIYFPNWNDEDVRVMTHVIGTRENQIVVKDRQLSSGLAWLPDGRLFFTLAEMPPAQGDSNVWALPMNLKTGTANGERVRITNGPDHKPVMDASADGKKILFLRTNIQPAVYVAQIDAKTKNVGWPERLTLDDRKNLPYEWTPDGKSVLYISNREGKFHIYRQAMGQGTAEVIETGADEPNILRLNPERAEILYTAMKQGDKAIEKFPHDASKDNGMQASKDAGNGTSTDVYRIMRVPLTGGQPKQLLEWPEVNNFQCARMPSRECIFSSYANQALEFYEFDAATGKNSLMFKISDPEWQLYNWTLSPDGTMLALAKKLRAQEEAEIQIMSLRGGSTRKIALKEWRSVRSIDWAADGKSIWTCASPREGEEMIVNVDLQGRVKQAVKEPSPYIGWAIPSQDGKRLAIWEASGASNVWMLEDF
ncbi:MAG: PD40 domain-containing protein [Acidobacteria bacterium]|nr:PD40 domain-containing protein [Acidobacteriota bacterium]MBS1866090.1 PD40 domain-containing protein [Acidobacteriota bacterium]